MTKIITEVVIDIDKPVNMLEQDLLPPGLGMLLTPRLAGSTLHYASVSYGQNGPAVTLYQQDGSVVIEAGEPDPIAHAGVLKTLRSIAVLLPDPIVLEIQLHNGNRDSFEGVVCDCWLANEFLKIAPSTPYKTRMDRLISICKGTPLVRGEYLHLVPNKIIKGFSDLGSELASIHNDGYSGAYLKYLHETRKSRGKEDFMYVDFEELYTKVTEEK